MSWFCLPYIIIAWYLSALTFILLCISQFRLRSSPRTNPRDLTLHKKLVSGCTRKDFVISSVPQLFARVPISFPEPSPPRQWRLWDNPSPETEKQGADWKEHAPGIDRAHSFWELISWELISRSQAVRQESSVSSQINGRSRWFSSCTG